MTVQRNWTRHSSDCGGTHQSPIHINTEYAIPLAIPALEMIGYHNLLPRPISVTNNGHSGKVNLFTDLLPFSVKILTLIIYTNY